MLVFCFGLFFKIHKQVGSVRSRLLLQLSEDQSTEQQRQQPPPGIAARWRCVPLTKKITAHYNSQRQLSLLFPLRSLKTPTNGSKLVLRLLLLFPKVCCFNFLYQAGLPSINVWLVTCYDNLTSTSTSTTLTRLSQVT